MAVAQKDAVELPELTIRPMLESDLPTVVRIEHASYAFPWTEGIFRDCLRVSYTCRVAEVDTAVVGYGILCVGAREAHLLNICIADSYRCRGIARRLLLHLLQIAARLGAEDAFLETRPSNASALHLYRSLGFVQIGMRRGYYQAVGGREDAVVLRRRIDRDLRAGSEHPH
jgi:ribosomal-protein-alanine N-acetyltransferase